MSEQNKMLSNGTYWLRETTNNALRDVEEFCPRMIYVMGGGGSAEIAWQMMATVARLCIPMVIREGRSAGCYYAASVMAVRLKDDFPIFTSHGAAPADWTFQEQLRNTEFLLQEFSARAGRPDTGIIRLNADTLIKEFDLYLYMAKKEKFNLNRTWFRLSDLESGFISKAPVLGERLVYPKSYEVGEPANERVPVILYRDPEEGI